MRTYSKIGKYKVFGDGPLPTFRVGVLADREGIIALNKPPAMYTFMTYFQMSGYPQLYDCIKAFWPLGAHAHRIDGTTSGCHMAGENHDALSRIITGWKTKTHKEYLAVVASKPKWDYIEITMDCIAGSHTMAPCTTGLEYLGDNLVKASLLDGGRTHQIRKALQAVGYPIVGDTLYGGEKSASRPLLHAWRVTVDGWGSVMAPTPDDMPDCDSDPYLWSFEVKPLTPKMQLELDEFRRDNVGGVYPKWKWRPGKVFGPDGHEISKRELKALRIGAA